VFSPARAILALIPLVACKETMTTELQNQYHLQRQAAGKVVYETTWVPARSGAGDALRERVLRHNTASPRVVYFDGKSSRTEEINADYGFRSPCIKLWLAGADTMLYCKELPHLRFCMPMPRSPIPVSGPPTSVVDGDDTRVIAGVQGRAARVIAGPVQLDIVHAPDIVLDDPTGAIDRIEGVSGFLLERHELPSSPGADYTRRVTVAEVSFAAPAPQLFARPDGFRWFPNVDAARAEDRRLGAAEAAPSTAERAQYIGRWELEGAPGAQVLEIRETRDGFELKTIEQGGDRTEPATLWGRQLRVDDAPNYRLYRLEPDGQHLVLVGDLADFRYRRTSDAAP
jgi:hypothetical protein